MNMISWASNIIVKHLFLILALIFISAMGRAIQTNGVGAISKTGYWLLEIPVETSRVSLFLLFLGGGSIFSGLKIISALFQMTRQEWKVVPNTMTRSLASHSMELLATTIAMVAIALVINCFIRYGAESPKLLSDSSQFSLLKSFSVQSLTLFLKNLTVIPLVIIFEVWLIFKLLNKV